jgi:carbonic anhydrase
MRIPIICAVLAALFAFGIYMTGGTSEDSSHAEQSHGQAATASHDKVAGEIKSGHEEAAHGDQMEHAKQMAHGMAAQHALHDQAVQKEADASDSHSQQVHWGYKGAGAPELWGTLSSEYGLCGTGRNQSPINLVDFIEAELPPLTFNYAGMAVQLVNNGHTIQADYHPGSTLVVDGRVFHLKQFHFHSPSENLIGGEAFPMEAHFVHADSNGNLAVVAVMFKTGATNKKLADLWAQMPDVAGGKEVLASAVKATDLLPEDRDYYRFNGSLTTPPCSQGVIWLVMKQPLTVSTGQVNQFSTVMGGPNNRPVQPLNARTVLQ